MSIERVIYGSLPKGLKSDNPGYTRYSYTRGYESLELNESIRRLMETNYTAPNMQSPYKDYFASENKTDEMRNDLSEQIQQVFPRSFTYTTCEVDNVKKGVFSFGKNMGLDWTNQRPNASFNTALICDSTYITKAPVFYCSSPLVCCDIPRSAFFGKDAEANIGYLRDVSDLNDTENIQNTPYKAGFEPITIDDISDFISDDDNADILIPMISCLLDLKSGISEKGILLVDSVKNNLLWIAALSLVFPVEVAKQISFSNYMDSFASSKLDVQGVFLPELNGVDRDNPYMTKYDYHDESERNFELFDFLNRVFPTTDKGSLLFMDMINNAFTIKMSILDDFKEFIETKTTYKRIDWDYTKGYALYYFLYKDPDLEEDGLKDAFDFAGKYANEVCKNEICKYFSDNYQTILLQTSKSDFFVDYIKKGIAVDPSSWEYLRSHIISDIINCFTNGDMSSSDCFNKITNLLEDLYGYSDEQVYRIIFENLGESGFLKNAEFNDWRCLCILLASITLICNNQNNYRSLNRVIKRSVITLYGSDNGKAFAHIINKVKELKSEKYARISFYDVFYEAFRECNNSNCSSIIIREIVSDYYQGSNDQRDRMIQSIKQSPYSSVYISGICQNPPATISFYALICFFNTLVRDVNLSQTDAQNISNILSRHLEQNTISDFDIEKCNTLMVLLNSLTEKCGLPSNYPMMMEIANRCYMILERIPVSDLNDSDLNKAEYIFNKADPSGKERYTDALVVVQAIRTLKSLSEAGSPLKLDDRTPMPDCSVLNKTLKDRYINDISVICTDDWVKTDRFPELTGLIKASNESDMVDAFDTILSNMLNQMADLKKPDIRHIADILEMSILLNNKKMLNRFDEWSWDVLRVKITKNDIIKELKKDANCLNQSKEKRLLKVKYPNDFLKYIDVTELNRLIEDLNTKYSALEGSGNGLLGEIKNKIFRRGRE